jgi:hypothetical protein
MNAFNALGTDVKLLLIAGCGAVLMAFAATDKKREKQYAFVAGVLVLLGALRLAHVFG